MLIIIFATIAYWSGRTVCFDTDGNGQLVLTVKFGERSQTIYPWYDIYEDVYYFFLPAFVEDNKIYHDSYALDAVMLNDEKLARYECFEWEEGVIYSVSGAEQNLKVKFMKSANLQTLFLSTVSGTLDELHADKHYEETGTIATVSANGDTGYVGKLNRISCRGNTTFEVRKKSYAITLENGQELCGLDYGRKWNLLALCFEKDKIHSKIIYDMARYIGMEYAPESTWVDVYCNGTYLGLYLLTESVDVAEGRVEVDNLEEKNEKANYGMDFTSLERVKVGEEYAYYDIENPTDISGGYLLEKGPFERVGREETFFRTDIYDYCFTVKSPSYTSVEELNYIKNYVQKIENLIAMRNSECWRYIDMDSCAKQFLIDKIVMEKDAMWDSAFYYKDAGSNVLKVGPLWDYDLSCGAVLTDYTYGIEDEPGAMNEWYLHFYADDKFREKMIEYYRELIPYLQEILEVRIDDYAEWISASRKMDAHIMEVQDVHEPDKTCTYEEYDNFIRYLKYFFANRLNFLNNLWGIDDIYFEPPASNGRLHKVRVLNENLEIIDIQYILDGESVNNLPEYDRGKYVGWKMSHGGKLYNDKIPVYEDVDLFLGAIQNE